MRGYLLATTWGPTRLCQAVILEVADRGPGLTREQAERVFERFYRADQARGRRTGGSGLGLAIVSALVAAHGGTAGVNTAPGQGATFWITLPWPPRLRPRPPRPPPSPNSTARPAGLLDPASRCRT